MTRRPADRLIPPMMVHFEAPHGHVPSNCAQTALVVTQDPGLVTCSQCRRVLENLTRLLEDLLEEDNPNDPQTY